MTTTKVGRKNSPQRNEHFLQKYNRDLYKKKGSAYEYKTKETTKKKSYKRNNHLLLCFVLLKAIKLKGEQITI